MGNRWKFDTYGGGAWAICDRCSQRWRRSQMIVEWDNLRVCRPCLDPRPPQMFAPDIYPEGIPFPDARPPQDNPDRLTDGSYLYAQVQGFTVTDGQGPPTFPNGQIAPLGAKSPQNVIVDTVPANTPPVGPYRLADDVTLRTGVIFPPSVT